jgi:hypothetical protein
MENSKVMISFLKFLDQFLYFSRGHIVNNSLQTSNLRQGNIKLLVASWAPLRYYFNRPAEVSVAMGEWATVNFCPCTFNNISVFSWWSVFIGEGSRSTRRKPLTCRKSLTNFIT